MFKFIKNLFGLGKESNTLTADKVVADVKQTTGIEVIDAAKTRFFTKIFYQD